MAQTIYAEAGGESFDGKRAVAHVIINRSKKRGISPCVVVMQRGQFVRKTGTGHNWKESIRAAQNLGYDLTNGAHYFKTLTSRIKWKYNLTVRIGNHNFYK